METTVYALLSKIDGSVYIGCTRSKTSKRLREHRCLLRNGKHTSPKLQEAWNCHGEVNFELIHLTTFPYDASLTERRNEEARWMQYYDKRGLLLNANPDPFAPTKEAIRKGVANAHNHPGNRWTSEVNEKRRQALLGISHNRGPKISATKRARRLERLKQEMR